MHTNTPFPGSSIVPMRAVASAAAQPANWFKFFQEERELWVQNVSTTQLSMQFEIAPGHVSGVLVPIGANPLCITNEVPFEAIKKSVDFRKFLNKLPPVMKLMTSEQAYSYFADQAAAAGAYAVDENGRRIPDVNAAIEMAERERKATTHRAAGDDTVVAANGQVTFSPPKSAQELQGMNMPPHMGVPPGAALAAGLSHVPSGYNGPQGFAPGYGVPGGAPGMQYQADAGGNGAAGFSTGPIMVENMVNPRVLNLCQQVSMQLAPNMRMDAETFWREIRLLEAGLSIDDFAYIEAHGTYRTVKKWAHDKLAEKTAAGQGLGVEDHLGG